MLVRALNDLGERREQERGLINLPAFSSMARFHCLFVSPYVLDHPESRVFSNMD